MLETVWEARAETLLRGSLAAPASCMRIVAGRLGRLEYNSERIRYEAPYDTGDVQPCDDGDILLPVAVRTHEHKQAHACAHKQASEHRA